jgi:nucleoside 2-deoxyribosyltransferase
MEGKYFKKFYVAGSFKNIDLVNDISKRLERLGFVRTYDWTKNKKNEICTLKDLRDIAYEEYAGILNSDFFVFIFPGGKGANIEFGIATASKKPIYVFDTTKEIDSLNKTSTFYQMDHVHSFNKDFQYFIEFIIKNV